MNTHNPSHPAGKSSYFLGFVLALTLTVIAFIATALHLENLDKVPAFARSIIASLASDGQASKTSALWLVTILAVAQLLVHLRFFLHLNLNPENHTKLAVISVTVVILFIVVGGTVWIMADVDRLMPKH